MLSLKDLIAGGKVAKFKQYRKGVLYYELEGGFVFEIPVVEVGDAHLAAEEKASLFMKWIKRAVDACNTAE